MQGKNEPETPDPTLACSDIERVRQMSWGVLHIGRRPLTCRPVDGHRTRQYGISKRCLTHTGRLQFNIPVLLVTFRGVAFDSKDSHHEFAVMTG